MESLFKINQNCTEAYCYVLIKGVRSIRIYVSHQRHYEFETAACVRGGRREGEMWYYIQTILLYIANLFGGSLVITEPW